RVRRGRAGPTGSQGWSPWERTERRLRRVPQAPGGTALHARLSEADQRLTLISPTDWATLCHRGCFDLHEDRRMEEARHTEKRRRRPTAGLGQPSQARGRGFPAKVDIGRVVVETHDVGELQAGLPEDRFDVVERLADLRSHVARMLRCAAGIDRRLPRADDGTLRPAHLVGLHEAQGVLPAPRIDHTSLHGWHSQYWVITVTPVVPYAPIDSTTLVTSS